MGTRTDTGWRWWKALLVGGHCRLNRQTRNDGLLLCLIVFYTAAPIRPKRQRIVCKAHRLDWIDESVVDRWCWWWYGFEVAVGLLEEGM